MDEELVRRHNEVVGESKHANIVVHAGDFTLGKRLFALDIISRLNGSHIFLRGSHDYWLSKFAHEIWEKRINKQWVVVCHYAMRVWARSHYGSWQLHGHSHGTLMGQGKQWDIGVDKNDFRPVSFDNICRIMAQLPDNLNNGRKCYRKNNGSQR